MFYLFEECASSRPIIVNAANGSIRGDSYGYPLPTHFSKRSRIAHSRGTLADRSKVAFQRFKKERKYSEIPIGDYFFNCDG